jgi:hypothetical protein
MSDGDLSDQADFNQPVSLAQRAKDAARQKAMQEANPARDPDVALRAAVTLAPDIAPEMSAAGLATLQSIEDIPTKPTK